MDSSVSSHERCSQAWGDLWEQCSSQGRRSPNDGLHYWGSYIEEYNRLSNQNTLMAHHPFCFSETDPTGKWVNLVTPFSEEVPGSVFVQVERSGKRREPLQQRFVWGMGGALSVMLLWSVLGSCSSLKLRYKGAIVLFSLVRAFRCPKFRLFDFRPCRPRSSVLPSRELKKNVPGEPSCDLEQGKALNESRVVKVHLDAQEWMKSTQSFYEFATCMLRTQIREDQESPWPRLICEEDFARFRFFKEGKKYDAPNSFRYFVYKLVCWAKDISQAYQKGSLEIIAGISPLIPPTDLFMNVGPQIDKQEDTVDEIPLGKYSKIRVFTVPSKRGHCVDGRAQQNTSPQRIKLFTVKLDPVDRNGPPKKLAMQELESICKAWSHVVNHLFHHLVTTPLRDLNLQIDYQLSKSD